ncbi:MAG: transketolase [Bacteroidota bacterium]|nr:transketolase [Bacteroidota bacterium]
MDLKKFASDVRKTALNLVFQKKASHIGGAFSMVELLTVLYNKILNSNPANPNEENRDRFLLSKGHACSTLYSTLALKGFFTIEELYQYTENGSYFTSHINHKIIGIELSTGSLGHALPVGCGLALAAKRKSETWQTYVMVSDGELNEGSNWEAILFAPQYNLDNLTLIVDYNKIQSLGTVAEVMELHPLADKFKAFRWEVFEIDGHNFEQIEGAFISAKNIKDRPSVIIANTIKGKGVDFMEDELLWHYKSPDKQQLEDGLKQIESEK